jgi:hypothetical protein
LTKANGSRVVITEVKRLNGQWQAYNPNETYIVSANDYRTSSRILTTGVFTQAELDGTSAPVGCTAFAPNILEIDCTRGHETAPDIISLMAYYVGMKGGVIDASDYEKNWNIVPWWETSIENGAYLRAQGERLTQEGKITNVTNSSALKAADVRAALALEETQKLSASVSAAVFTGDKELAEFLFSMCGLDHVNTVAIEFTLSGGNLSYSELEELNNFEAMPLRWEALDDNNWKGSLTLACLGSTVTSANTLDLVRLYFIATGLGDSTITIDKVEVTSQVMTGGELKSSIAEIEKGSATTTIIKTYSIYDITRDGVIGQADFAVVALACGITQEDRRWLSTIATVNGIAVTPAMCDVNKDGEVDMFDLVDVYLNYAASY